MHFSQKVGTALVCVTLLAAGCGGGGSKGSAAPDIAGVVVEHAPGRNHVGGKVDYPGKHPPSGGNHNSTPLTCGFYDQQPPDEFAVHSLEHGAVWIAFAPSTSAGDVQTLKAFAKEDHVVVSPYAGMDAPVTLVAWEHRLELQTVTDPRLKQFVEEYRNGAQAPERGAACQGAGQPVP